MSDRYKDLRMLACVESNYERMLGDAARLRARIASAEEDVCVLRDRVKGLPDGLYTVDFSNGRVAVYEVNGDTVQAIKATPV